MLRKCVALASWVTPRIAVQGTLEVISKLRPEDFLSDHMETRTDIEALITGAIMENLHLEYKRSDSLGKQSSQRIELCKDVSAFANSAGGRIIYGVPEIDHAPQPLDEGCDRSVINSEWIEQVLNSNINPRVQGVKIIEIIADIERKRSYFIIDIPQASSYAPHQAPDKKYYKRFNFQSVPMEDYEVRDTLRRSSTPALELSFQFEGSDPNPLLIFPKDQNATLHTTYSNIVCIQMTISNQSVQPADYAFVSVYIHPRLLPQDVAGLRNSIITVQEPIPRLMREISRQFGPPRDIPIFRELPQQIPELIKIRVQMSDAFSESMTSFPFGYRIRSPGCDNQRWGSIDLINQRLTIQI